MTAGGPTADPAGTLKEENLRLWLELAGEKARADLLASQLSAVLSSRSWRITAWLRRLSFSRPSRPVAAGALRSAEGGGDASRGSSVALPISIPAQVQVWVEQVRRSSLDAPHLWVDVTEVDLEDLGAGIQRVTRQVLVELMFHQHSSRLVVPVRMSREGDYCYAWRFSERLLGLPPGLLGAEKAVAASDLDAFLGLDFSRRHHAAFGSALERLKDRGVMIAVVVYDLLPRLRPEWFPEIVVDDYEAWLTCVARQADVAICISHATRSELIHSLGQKGLALTGRAEAVCMGSDALPALPRSSETATPTLLLVGTVEPRKGHADALDAMEKVWSTGRCARLVFVGRPGWKSEELQARIRNHSEFGRSLEWDESTCDADLAGRYASSDLLVMASEGEGYGLPLAEAGRAGCRLLARDLAVFREVAGNRAGYFGADRSLAEAIIAFLDAPHLWPDPQSRGWATWRDSGQAFQSCVDRMMGDSLTRAPRRNA